MPIRHYLEQADCESAVGGAKRLKQLLAQPGATTATVDAVKLESALSNTTGEMRSALGHDWNIDSFDALWFNVEINGVAPPAVPMTPEDKLTVKTHGKSVFRYWAWNEGGENQVVPQNIINDRDGAIKALQAIGTRLSAWGSQRRPGTARHYKIGQPLTPGNCPALGHRDRFRGMT